MLLVKKNKHKTGAGISSIPRALSNLPKAIALVWHNQQPPLFNYSSLCRVNIAACALLSACALLFAHKIVAAAVKLAVYEHAA